MDRLTQHSKTTMFTDSDVTVEGKRLGPAAFEGLSYYRHYVKIINRLAELEDRFCNEPQTNADRIRAMTDAELADFLDRWEMGDVDYSKTFCNLCDGQYDCHDDCLMDWLKSPVEVDDG